LSEDESRFPALVHSTPVIRDGKPVGLRGLVIYITERKKAEEALKLSIIHDYSSPDNPLDQLPNLWKKVIAG
jgi:hypothetical protein